MKESITLKDKIKLCSFILMNDKYSKGPLVKNFEDQWAQWLGVKYAVYVNSGSSANLLLVDAVKELHNIKDESEVLVPACTWSTNISPILQMNMKPVFCDIDFDNYSFKKSHLEKISSNHDIKLIFATHLLGLPSDINMLENLFPNAIIIEDCCESHGATLNGNKVGTLALGSTFSFYYGHHITSIEGGMVCTNDYNLYKLLLLKRSHGLARELPEKEYKEEANKYSDIDQRFLFITRGYNFRPTEFNAFIGIQQLSRLDSHIQNRRDMFELYVNKISSCQSIANEIKIPNSEGNSSYCFPVVFKNHSIYKLFLQLLNENKIEHRPIVGSNLTRQPFLKTVDIDQSLFPNTNLLHENGVYVGNNQFVTTEDVNLLVNLLKKAVETVE